MSHYKWFHLARDYSLWRVSFWIRIPLQMVSPYNRFPLIWKIRLMMDFPLQGISPYEGFPFVKNCPLYWNSLYTGFPLMRDFLLGLLQRIFIYKGFLFWRDFPVQRASPHEGIPRINYFPWSAICPALPWSALPCCSNYASGTGQGISTRSEWTSQALVDTRGYMLWSFRKSSRRQRTRTTSSVEISPRRGYM